MIYGSYLRIIKEKSKKGNKNKTIYIKKPDL